MAAEAKIEAHLVKRIEALGGEVRKLVYPGRKSAADRLLLLPEKVADNLFRTYNDYGIEVWIDRGMDRAWQHPMVELKAPGEVPRPDQLREHKRLRAAGLVVLVIDSKEQIDRLFPLA